MLSHRRHTIMKQTSRPFGPQRDTLPVATPSTGVRRHSPQRTHGRIHHAVPPVASDTGRNTVPVILAVAIGLSLNNYLKRSAPAFWDAVVSSTTDPDFARMSWWTVSNVFLLGVLPVVVARLSGWTFREMGFGLGSLRRHIGWYLGAAAVMVPTVIAISWFPAFQATYPFYRATDSSRYLALLPVWWLLYAIQFVAVEGLFRGVLAVGLVRRMRLEPLVAAGLATIPYAMIHFAKPAPETFGAIVAGVALSWLALRSRSIWGGVALHVTVALTMDIAVLHHLGIL